MYTDDKQARHNYIKNTAATGFFDHLTDAKYEKTFQRLYKSQATMVCLNDDLNENGGADLLIPKIQKLYDHLFPLKSGYEK